MNPGATRQARNLLCYVAGLYGNHILSGQQESTWIGGPEYEMTYIHDNTGKYPAVRSLDYGDSKDFSARAVAWWQAGGIPMVGYHMGAPTKPDTYEGTQMAVSIDDHPGRGSRPPVAENLPMSSGRCFLCPCCSLPWGTWQRAPTQ